MKIKKLFIGSLASMMFLSSFCMNSNAMPTKIHSGNTRVEVSFSTANELDTNVLIIANANAFPDALSAYNIAAAYNGKVILVQNTTDISSVLNTKYGYEKIFLMGGPLSLNGKPVEQANQYCKDVERVSGGNRYEANLNSLKISGHKTVGIADGRSFADALSASGLLLQKGMGLRLVDGSKPYSLNGMNAAYTFGGNLSVKYASGKRIGGGNRYEASLNINKELGNPEKLVVSVGNVFPDAISSINIVTANRACNTATLLVNQSQNKLTAEQRDYAMKARDAQVVGGRVSQGIIEELRGLESKNPMKNNGSDWVGVKSLAYDKIGGKTENTTTNLPKYLIHVIDTKTEDDLDEMAINEGLMKPDGTIESIADSEEIDNMLDYIYGESVPELDLFLVEDGTYSAKTTNYLQEYNKPKLAFNWKNEKTGEVSSTYPANINKIGQWVKFTQPVYQTLKAGGKSEIQTMEPEYHLFSINKKIDLTDKFNKEGIDLDSSISEDDLFNPDSSLFKSILDPDDLIYYKTVQVPGKVEKKDLKPNKAILQHTYYRNTVTGDISDRPLW